MTYYKLIKWDRDKLIIALKYLDNCVAPLTIPLDRKLGSNFSWVSLWRDKLIPVSTTLLAFFENNRELWFHEKKIIYWYIFLTFFPKKCNNFTDRVQTKKY